MPLSSQWTKGIKDEKKKKEFVDLLRNSTIVLGMLQTILRDKIKSLDSTERRIEDYDTPAWSHKQAHRNGQRSGYKEVIDMIASVFQKE